jgi:hypothetical protein
MKQLDIGQIQKQIDRLPRHLKIHVLRGHIASQKKRSFMRDQLQKILKPIVNQQIRREVRDEKRRTA